MSTNSPTSPIRRLLPFLLVVPFTAIITGWFNLSEVLPVPVAIPVGAAWGVVLGLLAMWASRRPRLSAWLENGSVYLGVIALAFAGCGGLMAILLLKGSLTSSTLTGESLEALFLPSIPYYIAVNSVLELLIVPAMICFGWRTGRRRVLIVATAALYFGMRVWTYLAFVPARLGWADAAHSADTMSAADRRQAAADLMVDDPRWLLLVIMLAILLVAAHLPRGREPELVAATPRN